MSTIKVDTVRPVTADASLTLQGDSGGSGVTGITIDSSGNATLAGTGNNIGTVTAGTLGSSVNIKASINASGSAAIYACRAWVNFNGTGTVAIRESGNVSSITDNGAGDYTVNFATAMPDANYSSPTCSDATNFSQIASVATRSKSTTSIQINTAVVVGVPGSSAKTLFDIEEVNVAIFR